MMKTSRWLLFASLGVLVTAGQAYLLLHVLINSKPYKVVDPSYVFYYTAYIGVPVSLILCGGLIYFMSSRIENYLLPMIPVIAFPIFVWSIYQIIFLYAGLDLFSGSGDFSVRQNELAFANEVIQVLLLGCVGGLLSVGISAVIVKYWSSEIR